MPTLITVNNITGSTPFEIYLCVSGGTPCYYIDQITESQIPYTFQVPVPLDNLGFYCVKLIDNDDYAATNGSTFSLTVPAVSGDVVEALSSRASVVLQTLMAQAYINALNAVTNNVGGMLYLWANYR